MRLCLYSPYLPKHTGGGEKYILDVARIAAQDHEVTVGIQSSQWQAVDAIRKKYESYFGFSLAGVAFEPTPLGTTASFFEKLFWTRRFDGIYYLTDGSLFFSLSRNNFLHVQIPFQNSLDSLPDKVKLLQWRRKNANSVFTKRIVEKSWQTKVEAVHYPLVAKPEQQVALDKKEPIILSVGRFFRHLHSKRQDVLVTMFSKLQSEPAKKSKWRLVLVGGVEDKEYFAEVQQLAKGLSVDIVVDASRQELESWYQKASIYWHACGFEVDESRHPEKVEHFGIAVVEAMSYGCVPVVIKKGGLKESLGTELADLGWETQDECLETTKKLLGSKKERERRAKQAMQRATFFSEDAFAKRLKSFIAT